MKNYFQFIILNLCLLCHFLSVSDSVSDKVFERKPPISSLIRNQDGEEPATDLQDLQIRLNEIYGDLQKIKLSLFLSQNKDNHNLDMKILKCATELSRNNEMAAIKYWEDLHIYLAPHEEAKNIASRLIDRFDLSDKQSVVPVLNFVEYMNIFEAYDTLQKKLRETGHFYGNHQVFMLAENVRKTCGTNQSAFTSLPPIIRDLSSSIVVLKNKWNNGYLYYESNFFTWFSPHKHRNNLDDLAEDKIPRAEWRFNLIGDKVQIVNNFNGDILIDPKMIFTLELITDDEIRLKVDNSTDTRLIGKYLVGKGRNRGEQFSPIAFQNISTAHQEHVIWKAEPHQLKSIITKVKRC